LLKFTKTMKKGFTIVEVLAGIVILSIGIIAVVNLFPSSTRVVTHFQKQTQAIYLAQSKLEEVNSIEYDDLTVGIIEPKHEVQSGFQRQTQVSLVDGDLAESDTDVGLKKITVTVFWKEEDKEKSVKFYYLKTRE